METCQLADCDLHASIYLVWIPCPELQQACMHSRKSILERDRAAWPYSPRTQQKGERSRGDQLHNAWNNPHSIASKQHSKAGRSPTIELSQIGDLVSLWSISMTNVTIAHGGNMLHSSRPGCMAGTSIRCVRHWCQRKLNEPGSNKHKIDPHWHNQFHPKKTEANF